MRIGLDFDNTIVSYDVLFHKVAREQDVVPVDTPVSKVTVRDYLRKVGREEIWTEMQGYVYGVRMKEAAIFPGVIDFLQYARRVGHNIAIISHKTRHPFLGPQYDLHAAARAWVAQYLCDNDQLLIPAEQVFFELTKEDKLARIGQFGCDIFIDDLPEILLAANFPATTQQVLFDPENNHAPESVPGCAVVRSWSDFARFVA